MNFEQAKIVLQKIERLMQTMSLDAANISPIEKDLMQSYVKQLSDHLDLSVPVSQNGSSTLKQADPVETVEPKEEIQTEAPIEKIQDPEPEPEMIKPKQAVKIKTDHDELRKRVEENAKKAASKLGVSVDSPVKPKVEKKEVVKEAVVEKVEKVEKIEKAEKTATPVVVETDQDEMDEIEALFKFREAKELSEKLGDLPIRDLSTALGLNEKIFTINELFGGDKETYDVTIHALNGFVDFEQAKEYLSKHVATKFKWANNERKKKAKIFIKMVRRRYK